MNKSLVMMGLVALMMAPAGAAATLTLAEGLLPTAIDGVPLLGDEQQLEMAGGEQVLSLRYHHVFADPFAPTAVSSPVWLMKLNLPQEGRFQLVVEAPERVTEWPQFIRMPRLFLVDELGQRTALEARTAEQWMATLL
ncbi:DUF2057 family protein [Ferrimonas balearica]|uniref:DUF2057 family protein n=1 Tax=Ferrimonas balearica TaxID=44012 RepID=UPI001F37B7FB|nr:DUF2057 family protein [Ferrimonas balearica]MBY6019395.1 DUF2057 family protein [Halomonas denitrificans]MBY6096253.1 DUF2057 family protein [Ferrimonas balearica]